MTARHRLFAYCLLMRQPLPGEESDIDAAYAWARARTLWLALAYLTLLALTVWPAFAEDHDLAYRAVALVGTHFILWGIVSTMASCWVGFRRGEKWTSSVGPVQLSVGAVLILLLCFLVYADIHWQRATHRWMIDTFGWAWLFALVLVIAYGFPELVARLRRRERAAVVRALEAEASSEKLARKTAESELRLLQAQVEPHFLYNTLANLRYLIQKNSPDALRMTDALIEYLRTSVPDMRASRVTLGREIDHARHYLEIMRMRMGSRLTFTVDVPDHLRATEVPPLLLLTLVENAVKHGIAPRVEGGEIALRARDGAAVIELEVADTGAGMSTPGASSTQPLSTGVGIENLRGRLQLAYGQPVALDMAPNMPRGTRVRVSLPREMLRPGGALDAQVRAVQSDEAAATGQLARDGIGSVQ
ncbi:MAG TPA: histidine kinase [Burkholderiaceae bacterium]|nr:histidine kinase [Burkholderiaceae bacterium]